MTDAQIALYAALRVAVPGEWRISGLGGAGTQVCYFERPVFTPLATEPRLRQHTGFEKLALACHRRALEDHPERVIQHMIYEAQIMGIAA